MNEFQRRLLDEVKYTDYIGSFADPSKEVLYIDNYSYVISFHDNTNLITTVPKSFLITMDSDSDFVMTNMAGQASTTLDNSQQFTTTTGSAILMQIVDELSGRTYFNQPTMMPLVCGDAGFPFIMPSPRIVYARGILNVTVQSAVDISSSGVNGFNQFYLALNGSRIFYK